MKFRNKILQLFFILIVMQSGVAFASSFHTPEQTNSDIEMTCHHHDMKMGMSENSPCASGNMATDSCCKVSCQCSSASCTAVSFIIPQTIYLSSRVDLATKFSLYTFVLPQTIQHSLFRPPIYS